MADSIKFSSGLKEFELNGVVTVSFNPTDMTFTESLYTASQILAKKQDELEEKMTKLDEPEDVFALNNEYDREMREVIDGLFGKPICSDLFGATKVFAYSDGLPLWANLVFAVLDKCVDKTIAERGVTDKRLEKYKAKYQKKGK